MLPTRVLYYGKDEPLPEQVALRAGPLTMLYEGGDLRYIKLGKQEILRRVYVAIRDRNWGTVQPVLSNVDMDISDDRFRISYDVRNREGDIDFTWEGVITGAPDGTVSFTMDGVGQSTFWRNRIGFCILHPMRECAGQACVVAKVDGSREQGLFPRYISPHEPFLGMEAISHEVIPGVWANVQFSGDVFEMEDQRNWTDASYKTYCTPLTLPFPVEVNPGDKVSQSVTLTLEGDTSQLARSPEDRPLSVGLGKEVVGHLPKIGLAVASHDQALSKIQTERLKALKLSHLRVDLDLQDVGFKNKLEGATEQAGSLSVPMEIALHLTDAAETELSSLTKVLNEIKPPVCRWLVFHTAENSISEQWIKLARRHLADYDTAVDIGGGTDFFFTELNREHPPTDVLDLVSYSFNPQVHAFDNASMVETLEAQAATVESARQFSGGLPLTISTITLKMRSNPNATGPEPEPEPGQFPSRVDERQMSLFGAGWTAGSLKYVSEGGASSVTYFETTGWLGTMELETGSPLPGKFQSIAGGVFPLYHVLADVGEFAGADLIPAVSSDSLTVDGLALRKNGRTRVIVANLGPEQRQVSINRLDQTVAIRRLNETNAEQAMRSPEEFRSQPGEIVETEKGTLRLNLLPYETARIDSV